MTIEVPTRGAVLITGATGFVGMEVLAGTSSTPTVPSSTIRARDEAEAQERLRGTVACVRRRGGLC